MTSADIRAALFNRRFKRRAGDGKWLYGYAPGVKWVQIAEFCPNLAGCTRWIDVFEMAMHDSDDLRRIAYEIKVSRSDFLAEVKNPAKRSVAMMHSNQFFFVAPVGLIRDYELPQDCGLIEVDDNGKCEIKSNATVRYAREPTWGFVAALCRRIGKLQDRQ